MLSVRDIHVHYGKSHIVQGISLNLERGEVLAVLGRNGMGKTSLVHAIAGFIQSSGGAVHLDGVDLRSRRVHEIARLGVAIVPQGRRIFPSLLVRETIRLAERASGRGPRRDNGSSDRLLELFPNLRARWNVAAGKLSGGEQQMLSLARALATNPKLLLMDEPTEGLAPLKIDDLRSILSRLKDDGQTILLVEQNVDFALKIANRVVVIEKGRILMADGVGNLKMERSELVTRLGI